MAGASLTQVQQSISNLQRAAQAIAAAQAAQRAARAAALNLAPTVPDGLAPGGLQPEPGVTAGSQLWQGAGLPTQSNAANRDVVTVKQASKQAVLTWQTLNVGRNTTLAFDQSAGGAAANSWVALNRVMDPNSQPSQILGQITAPGQVYIINRNGVIFGATAQVNTGALIASSADINTTSFLQKGIYSPSVTVPSFTGGAGAITVEQGAEITTNAPSSPNIGGGFVLLMGSKVQNAGWISAPRGQAAMVAGRDIVVSQGFGSNSDAFATVQGNQFYVPGNGSPGAVTNSGLIDATDGDITLAGHNVTQAGVVAASTGLGQRGTVHLLTSQQDATATVSLAPGSTTAITIDNSSDTAIEALRAQGVTNEGGNTAELPTFAGLPDVADLSRIEITSGGAVGFGAGSLALATSGQVAVSAKGTVLMAPGAVTDVSGLVGVTLPQSANVFQVSIEPYNLRDSPLNRDTTFLNSQSVSIDARTLQFVPASTVTGSGDATARYYTAGGLLEVGGELQNVPHTLAEYSTTGGTVQIQSAAMVAQPGAAINLAGGSIQYLSGPVPQTWLLGQNGKLYNLSTATDSVVYAGVFNGFTETHPHWNVSQTFSNPLVAPPQVNEAGYTVGHNAGSLTISAATVAFAGTIDAGTVVGVHQNALPVAGETGLLVGQTAVPQGGTLVLATALAPLGGQSGVQLNPGTTDVLFGDAPPDTSAFALHGPLPRRQQGKTVFSAATLDAAGLQSITVETTGSISVTSSLAVADGGSVALLAPVVQIGAPVAARSGSVTLGEFSTVYASKRNLQNSVTVGAGAGLDVRGVWTNASLDPLSTSTEAWINGGSVSVQTTGSIVLAAGSTIDASSGGFAATTGSISGGKGGSITLQADILPVNGPVTAGVPLAVNPGPSRKAGLVLDGTLRSIGFSGGGTLTLQAPGIAIGDGLKPSYAGELLLSPTLFTSGFSNYVITSATNIRVAPGAQVDVVEPVYEPTLVSASVPGGSDPAAAFQVYLPPLFLPNPQQGKLTQRVGAGLTLDAPGETPVNLGSKNQNGGVFGPANPYGSIQLGSGANIVVDPFQSVILAGSLAATIDGTIRAPSGTIDVLAADSLISLNQLLGNASVSIGPSAVLDTAGIAATALDSHGRPYGTVTPGGVITLGNTPGVVAGQQSATDAPILIARGATLDASGAAAVIDLTAGLAASPVGALPSVPVADDTSGGTIRLASYTGIAIDGTLRAPAGGASASGGSLDVILEAPIYNHLAPTIVQEDRFIGPRRIVVTQDTVPAAPTVVGVARVSVNAITSGGFGSVSLFGRDGIMFDGNVALAMPQAIALGGGALADSALHGQVTLSAPYVLLFGSSATNGLLGGGVASGVSAAEQDVPATLLRHSTLTINADLIDLQNSVLIGSVSQPQISLSDGKLPAASAAPGFGTVNLVSTGDVRFLGGSAAVTYESPSGTSTTKSLLVSYGDVLLTASQIYPVTDANVEIDVGIFVGSYTSFGGNFFGDNKHARLTIARNGPADPSPPLSIFGNLGISAPTIDQGGVLRAPFGVLNLGAGVFQPSGTLNANSINLLPGSVTSVSAAGLTVPYGGTSDGLTYDYNGTPVPFFYSTQRNPTPPSLAYGISIAGQSVVVDGNATLDLQGGGMITGAGFVAGRGGSADTLTSPLVSFTSHGATIPTLGASDTIYALIPGFTGGYAPSAPLDASASYPAGLVPGVGQTVTVGNTVPGLPAGTYTLLPAYYALQPGAYRIELRSSTPAPIGGTLALPNGSYIAAVNTGIANTQVRSSIPTSAIITPGTSVRRYSQYNEESYSTFAASQTAVSVFGTPEPVIPLDSGELDLVFGSAYGRNPSLVNDGTTLLGPAPGAVGGTLAVLASNTADSLVIGDGRAAATPGTVLVNAAALNAFGPTTLLIGGTEALSTGSGSIDSSASIDLTPFNAGVTIAKAAVLTAPQVLLVSSGPLRVAQGATIDTVGRTGRFLDSSSGLRFAPNAVGTAIVGLSNGSLLFAPATSATGIGGSIRVDPGATLDTAGTLAFATSGAIDLSPLATLGALDVRLGAASINIGSPAQIKRAKAPAGLLLSQTLLNRLLAGDPAAGVPALQELDLTATQSVNFFNSAQLGAIDPLTALPRLSQLVVNTPGIYGYGKAGDTAVLTVGTLYWNGLSSFNSAGSNFVVTQPPLVAAGGPGSGSGTLDIAAQQIVFGPGPNDTTQFPASNTNGLALPLLQRATFGFGTVNVTASQQIVAADRGTLSVYQTQGSLQPNGTLTGAGGVLAITTPLLTTASNGTLDIAVGGALTLAPGTAGPSAARPSAAGGEIGLAAAYIADSTAIVLPSGRLIMTATGDITLAAGSRLDVSGEDQPIFDQTVSGPGGTVALTSSAGSVVALAGSVIAFAGTGNRAGGSLSVSAARGAAALDGTIAGGGVDAVNSGGFTLDAAVLPSFAALNQTLTSGGIFGARDFEIGGPGNLTIETTDQLRAHVISVSVDGGSLIVDGLVDASGTGVGTIDLSGQSLTLTANARLQAQGSALRRDSYGQPIDAANRAEVSLTSAAGPLVLSPGAQIDLASADGIARGDLELNAPRTSADGAGIQVSAPGGPGGGLAVTGAATIALNGFWTYQAADGTITQTNLGKGGAVIDPNGIGLDQINIDSTAFETAALAALAPGGALQAPLAGLTAYGSAFHLRPGVLIESSSNTLDVGGTLQVDGDLNLSGFRYGPNATGNGTGEPGVLLLRAAGNLDIYGSISDGFKPPPATPDSLGWELKSGSQTYSATVLTPVTLEQDSSFPAVDIALTYPLDLAAGARVNADMAVPAGVTVTLEKPVRVAEAWLARGTIRLADGTIFGPGQIIPAGTLLPAGTTLGAGSTLPQSYAINAVTWPAGSSLGVFATRVTLAKTLTLTSGDTIPAGAILKLSTPSVQTRPAGGQVDALAAMLPAGSLSWTVGLVAGANLAGAATDALLPATPQASLGATSTGNLILDDLHRGAGQLTTADPIGFSVVRTGTGSLTLAAGGFIAQETPFGIYTAGTQSGNVPSVDEPTALNSLGLIGSPAYQKVVAEQLSRGYGYQPYYPSDGGNLTVTAQGSFAAVNAGAGEVNANNANNNPSGIFANLTTGWLWQQGSATNASWWINFGSYAQVDTPNLLTHIPSPIAGFTGLGTLGGGNVTMTIGGAAGGAATPLVPNADGIIVAVASTGFATNRSPSGASVTEFGGGDLSMNVGGAILGADLSNTITTATNTVLTSMRGNAVIAAGSVGVLQPLPGASVSPADPRFNPSVFNAETADVNSGVTLAVGDGVIGITTRGDLAVADALDPGREGNNFFFATAPVRRGPANILQTGFSLWQPGSGVDLLSTGGNISPVTAGSVYGQSIGSGNIEALDEYPPNLAVAAQHGSVYFSAGTGVPVELAPSASGTLSILADQSIYGPAVLSMSGAPAGNADLPNPFKPVYAVTNGGTLVQNDTNATNTNAVGGTGLAVSLFVFELDTPIGPLHPQGAQPIRLYAGSGDIVDVTVGQTTSLSTSGPFEYKGSIPARVEAGGDIVNFGQPVSLGGIFATSSAGLLVNGYASDISVLEAGRDIIYANVDVAGPGLLYVQAGRDVYQGDQGVITSLGQQVVNPNISAADRSSGAGITVLAGTGSSGPDYSDFADLYLNDANQANLGLLLTDPANAGKVQQTYGAQLLAWLQQNTGYTGDQAGALAAFLSLPPERQSEFLLPVYFDELRQSGRQFTDATSRFYKSYARGKQAIATLFPSGAYQGGVTLFATPNTSNSGTISEQPASAITTNYGGSITVLAPGGAVTLGTSTPGLYGFGSPYGVLTFGQGDINMYSEGSVLLGTSRIFTTFGGGITIWSAEGDINAGQGTKSAVVAQPFSLVYDSYGDITLSPQAPSTGAGIATLNEIPGTVPGDVDLVAPQGTIDAGEAGIRSSGNANLAALAIANGANLQVQGKTTGTPVVAVPNIGALNAAAAVSGAAENSAQQTAAQKQQNATGSIITVEVLGFGG